MIKLSIANRQDALPIDRPWYRRLARHVARELGTLEEPPHPSLSLKGRGERKSPHPSLSLAGERVGKRTHSLGVKRAKNRTLAFHDAEISVAFLDDEEMRRINRQYLGHDFVTDVITFPMSESGLEGEILIGGPHAVREARLHGHTPTEEAGLYLVHGMLHLGGYDDRSVKDRKVMHARQEAMLKDFLRNESTQAASAKRRSNGRR